MMAKRSSPIESFLAVGAGLPVSNGTVLAGEPLGELRALLRPLFGRHFNTASTDALHGCTCRGYENVTRITIAALPIVEAVEGMSKLSASVSSTRGRCSYTFQQCFQQHCFRKTSSQ